MKKEEYPLLRDFTYEAIFVPEGEEAPPRGIVDRLELKGIYADFGRPGDACLVAEAGGVALGAVWARLFTAADSGYGYVDDETPELAIAIFGDFRGAGIGTALMRGMLALLRARGFARASLSVQRGNAARRLYERLGFEIVREAGGALVMVYPLTRPCP